MTEVAINKELYTNIRAALNRVIVDGWIEQVDTENNFVVTERFVEMADGSFGYREFKQSYDYDGQLATLLGDPIEVVIKRSIEEVTAESSILKKIEALVSSVGVKVGTKACESIAKNIGGSDKSTAAHEVMPEEGMVIKQFQDEEMIVCFAFVSSSTELRCTLGL